MQNRCFGRGEGLLGYAAKATRADVKHDGVVVHELSRNRGLYATVSCAKGFEKPVTLKTLGSKRRKIRFLLPRV